uniref:Ig-like domain-containing protein n=1 Tax=Astyanax mexicanus TaxID=7994 RepID=A0A8B9KIU1_ASTMX
VGCTLENNQGRRELTARSGESVLLPCFCTTLHFTPETFSWKKLTNTWTVISSESDQYRNRVQLFNNLSPANLSLLISHLTEEDDGGYRCNVKHGEFTDIRLTVTVAPVKPSPTSVRRINHISDEPPTIISSQKGCSLENYQGRRDITARSGESVLLPCFCTYLPFTPETITWKKYTNTWTIISSESDQYRNRVQLFNHLSPANLSLLISHLTEEDAGFYRCEVKNSGYTDISLTVEGCRLNYQQLIQITAHTGESVLLPCSCTDLQTTPDTFTWKKDNTISNRFEEISSESDQYRNRVQLFNNLSPANLSLLISHLTEEDAGWYRCEHKQEYMDIRLTVTVAPTTPERSNPVAEDRTSTAMFDSNGCN